MRGGPTLKSISIGLVEGALVMAISRRQPKGGVVHDSDQGSQCTSLAFGERCRKAGIVQSMGSVGDAYDTAMCESFFATLECELLDRRRFATVNGPPLLTSTSVPRRSGGHEIHGHARPSQVSRERTLRVRRRRPWPGAGYRTGEEAQCLA